MSLLRQFPFFPSRVQGFWSHSAAFEHYRLLNRSHLISCQIILPDHISKRGPEGRRIEVIQLIIIYRLGGIGLSAVADFHMCMRTAGTADASPGLCGNLLASLDGLSCLDSVRSRMKVNDGLVIGTVVYRNGGQAIGSCVAGGNPCNYTAV